MDLHWLSSPVAKHELQWSVLTFFSCTLKVKFVLKLWQQKSLPASTRKLLMLSWSFFNRFYLVLTGIDDPLWCVSFLWFFLLGFMKRFGQLWSLLMINLDQNKLSPKGSKTKQAWRVSSGLSYLSFVLKPEGKSGLVTLQRGLEDGVMFFAAICGQEVDCDCNPLQLCSFKLPASSLKAEYNALDILCDLIYQRLWFFFCHQGRLAGVGGEDLPTIVVVAHYDSFGVAPVCLLLLFFLQINPDSFKTYRKFSSWRNILSANICRIWHLILVSTLISMSLKTLHINGQHNFQ